MNVKSLFGAVYQRVAFINTTQLCLLFCGAACIFVALQAQKRPYQRFVPISDSDGNSTVALDTKTGRACLTLPIGEFEKGSQELIAKGGSLPLCYGLYKETK